jgi:hypothetical protein
MNPLSNSRHEAFAQARFSGMSVMEAYRAAGYVGELPQIASKVSQHPDVKARLMELHNAAAKVMAYERLDAIKDLLTIVKARPSEAAADHPLCEVRTGRNGQYHRFPSKLRAMARLVKIMGWDEPPKVNDEEPEPTDRLTLLLMKVRKGNRVDDTTEDDHEDELDIHGASNSGESNATLPPPEEKVPGEKPHRGLCGPLSCIEADAPPTPRQENSGPHSPLCGSGNPPIASLTPRQEAFARARFSGMGVMEAYQAAGYLGLSPERASRVSRHPPVAARLAQLRKDAEDALPYKRHEFINDLIAIVHASPEEASEDNPLCESRMGHEGPYYRFPCKLAAMMLLVRVMGWLQPQKVELHLGVPKLDGLDRLRICVQARADREEREKARKAAGM